MHKIIKELESDNSRLFKEAVIAREAKLNNDVLFEGFRLACDNFKTFGVKQIPESTSSGPGLKWEDFKVLAQSLYKRELTGHAARDAIQSAMTLATQDEWDFWYRRILIKDLRCGVSETSINKMVSKINKSYIIDVFETQLAFDGAKHSKKLAGKKLLDLKYDGARLITIINVENRTVSQYTRNGKEVTNFPHIVSALLENIDKFDQSWVLDGELISVSFQALMRQMQRKSDVQTLDAKLMLFDILPLAEFQHGISVLNQQARLNLLHSFKSVFDTISSIQLVDQVEVDLDTDEGQLKFKEYNRKALDAKLEGIMIKDPYALYECKRSVAWLKQKPILTVDLEIVALEEGTGKNAGRLGAFVCEGYEDGKFIRVNVGSGLSDAERIEVWNNKEKYIGLVIEIECDAITKSQDDDNVYSLRFPRFVTFRGFVAGEKI